MVTGGGRRIALALLVAAFVVAWFALDLGRFLRLDELQARRGDLEEAFRTRPLRVVAGFFAAYVAVSLLALPGAAVLTMAAGAVFGLVRGTVLVSFASTLGATIAFLASRYLFRDAVARRFGDRLRTVDEGIARDGAAYLFTLRLVPVFPFFLVNPLVGLTSLPARTFAWVSQLGMLPGTVVYVNAGTRLADVRSLDGILSPGLLLAFALLGVFPLAAKWIARAVAGSRG
ncbi:MAG: TVP38/TMEM64 family protein [Alphaproteobacteria bacterium]